MSETAPTTSRWRQVTRHVAFKALMRSVLINIVAPSLLYRMTTHSFAAGSLAPLAISGLPPIAALAYSLIKLRAIDFLGLFAAENVLVSLAALLLAHGERGALIGRSLPNLPLAAIFLASLAFRKPLMFYMARQFATGNDAAAATQFDRSADHPPTLAVYRTLTWVWTVALVIKCAGSVCLATSLQTKTYLIASPLWDLVTDSALVSWSILYGRTRLGDAGNPLPAPRLSEEAAR